MQKARLKDLPSIETRKHNGRTSFLHYVDPPMLRLEHRCAGPYVYVPRLARLIQLFLLGEAPVTIITIVSLPQEGPHPSDISPSPMRQLEHIGRPVGTPPDLIDKSHLNQT